MKTMNKVIAAMMLMAITTAMPAMAGKTTVSTSRQNHNNGKNDKVVVVNNDYQKNVRARVENMKGVMDTKWNPRTHELTVIYDAKITSARNIKHSMA